jgi:hypothetical protein
LEYLDHLTKTYGEEYSSIKPLYAMIENNEVISFLKARGYKYIHLGSWYPGTKTNKNADIVYNYKSSFQNNFLNKFIETTALDPILQKFFTEDPRRESVRRGTNYELNQLAKIPEIEIL